MVLKLDKAFTQLAPNSDSHLTILI